MMGERKGSESQLLVETRIPAASTPAMEWDKYRIFTKPQILLSG